MSYEALLNDLEQLQKSYAEEDERIQAAAAQASHGIGGDGEDDADDDEDAARAEEEGADEDEDGGETFGKSYVLVDEDGRETQAVDGTALVKSLTARLKRVTREAEADKSALAKSILALKGLIEHQGKQITTLAERLTAFSSQGAGRKSVTLPSESMAKSMVQMTPQLIKSRAAAAFKEGRLSGAEYIKVDVDLRHGTEIDPEIAQRLMA